MLQSPRVYGLSIWLEVSHPFNSLKRDKDLHTFPKITQCHHQHVYATISDFNRDTIVICQGRRLQRRRHLNSKLLLECELTDSIRLRSYYVYTYKLWEFAVVCPFVHSVQTSFLACAIFGVFPMSIIMHLYPTTHNLSILMDFTCNAIHYAPFSRDFRDAEKSKVDLPIFFSGGSFADFLRQSSFAYRSLAYKQFSVSQSVPDWLRTHMPAIFSMPSISGLFIARTPPLAYPMSY